MLKLDLDPDDLSLHSFAAWDHFKDEVRRYCPSYFVQPAFIDARARIATANNNVSLTAITTSSTSFALVFDMLATHAKRRWRMFEKCRDVVIDSLPSVTWEMSPTWVSGTLQVNDEGDVKGAIVMLDVLNRHIKQR